ncbi:Late embryogenesis abundant protein ECP63 [Linum perenne]
MASEKEKMEKAEEAAWQAAYNLREVNRQRDYEERAKTVESNTVPPAFDHDQSQPVAGGGQPGVFGSMFRAVAETVGHARDAVAGKGQEVADKTNSAAETVAEKTGETKEAAKGKATETKDYTAEKANEAANKTVEVKDAAKDKAAGAKDYTAEKANEAAEKAGQVKDAAKDKALAAKDYTAEKANQAADKVGEVKDAAKDKATAAKDYTAEKANQAADKVGEVKDAAKDKAVAAKDYTSEKANQAAEKAGEMKDSTMGKTEEYKNSAVDKAKETKDYTSQKTNEAAEKVGEVKDATKDKAVETKDYTADKANEAADKAKQGTETAGNKLGGMAKMAMDFFSGKKDEKHDDNAMHITQTMMDEKTKEAEEETRRRVEELRIHDEAEKADYQHRKDEAERGKAARDNIFGAVGLGTIVDSVRSKLTKPEDVVEETKAAREHGGTGRRSGGDQSEMPLEKTRPGAVAATIKAADQMSGQTFNDVGRMGDEGVVHVEKEEVIRRKNK